MKKEDTFLKSSWERLKLIDLFFLQLTVALMCIGLLFAFSSSAYLSFNLTKNFWFLGFKQLLAFMMGMFLFILFFKMSYKKWYNTTWVIAFSLLVVMGLMLYTPMGKVTGGSRRWIDLVIFQFQPAEVVKFSVILLTARFLTKYNWKVFKSYYYLLLVFILIGMVFKQPDLGSTVILFLVLIEMLFMFGFPTWLITLLLAGAFSIAYFKITSTPYQAERIHFWLHPEEDPSFKGFNIIQSRYALALGGLFGTGFGNSFQKQGNLPVPHSDFIFAVIAEEIGFLGVLAVLILYLTWILRGIFLVNKIKNKYGRILGSSIIFLIATQAVVNISVASGLFPVTGVTLPFFSCGGTSLIVTLSMCGVLFNILSAQNEEVEKIVSKN